MTKASIFIGSIMFAVSVSPALSFDFTRFSYTSTEQQNRQSSMTPLAYSQSNEDFQLDSNGKITRKSQRDELNTFASIPIKNGSADKGQLASPRPKDGGLSSSNDQPPVPGISCQPAVLAPKEIEALVEGSARAHDVDPNFAKAIAWTESRFDQDRTSPKGAYGVMQLMPDTAAELGVQDICDTASNIDGGIRHLKSLIDEFQNPLLAAAAYNAGTKAVYDAGGIPAFRETVRYVADVANFQMGLRKPGAVRRYPLPLPARPTEEATDVIGAKASQFVKGVMQF